MDCLDGFGARPERVLVGIDLYGIGRHAFDFGKLGVGLLGKHRHRRHPCADQSGNAAKVSSRKTAFDEILLLSCGKCHLHISLHSVGWLHKWNDAAASTAALTGSLCALKPQRRKLVIENLQDLWRGVRKRGQGVRELMRE